MAVNVIGTREFLVDVPGEGLESPQGDLGRMFLVASQLEGRGHRMRVAFTVHATQVRGGSPPSGRGRPGAVSLFRDRGNRPAMLWPVIAGEGGFEEALRYLANQRERVELGGEITRVEMHVWEEK